MTKGNLSEVRFWQLLVNGSLLNSGGMYMYACVNPLSLQCDRHQISLCNIHALSNRVVIRITDMITKDEFTGYFINFSPLPL